MESLVGKRRNRRRRRGAKRNSMWPQIYTKEVRFRTNVGFSYNLNFATGTGAPFQFPFDPASWEGFVNRFGTFRNYRMISWTAWFTAEAVGPTVSGYLLAMPFFQSDISGVVPTVTGPASYQEAAEYPQAKLVSYSPNNPNNKVKFTCRVARDPNTFMWLPLVGNTATSRAFYQTGIMGYRDALPAGTSVNFRIFGTADMEFEGLSVPPDTGKREEEMGVGSDWHSETWPESHEDRLREMQRLMQAHGVRPRTPKP